MISALLETVESDGYSPIGRVCKHVGECRVFQSKSREIQHKRVGRSFVVQIFQMTPDHRGIKVLAIDGATDLCRQFEPLQDWAGDVPRSVVDPGRRLKVFMQSIVEIEHGVADVPLPHSEISRQATAQQSSD